MLDKFVRINGRPRKKLSRRPNDLDAALDRVADAVEKALVADPTHRTCRTCSQPIKFKSGSAFVGWSHANGELCCGIGFSGGIAEPTPERLKIGRIRIKGVQYNAFSRVCAA